MLDFFIWGGVIIILDIIEWVISKMRKVVNIRYLILGMLISGIMFGTGTYAATVISGNNISYVDNANLGVNNVQAAIDGTCTKFSSQLTNLKNDVISQIYPIGSIYISTNITNASDLKEKLGVGTWESYGKGKTLVGVDENDSSFNSVEKTGGSKTVKLNTSNLPNHTHVIPSLTGSTVPTDHTQVLSKNGEYSVTPGGDTNAYVLGNTDYKAGASLLLHLPALSLSTNASNTTTCNDCSNTSFSIQNQYITVYMYKRIS